MTARLAQLLEALERELAGVTFRTGGRRVAQHDRPPRIVWVPTRDAFTPATKGGTNPRSVRTRIAGVEAHVWGTTLEQAEDLVHRLVVALHRLAHGSYKVRTCVWDKPEWMEHGEACVLAFEFAIPVTDEPAPQVVVAAVAPDTAEPALPGTLACGTP